MATKRKTSKSSVPVAETGVEGRRVLSPELGAEFEAAYNALEPLRIGWTEKENMLISKLGDSISAQFKSRVTDSRLATIVIERSARVMSQIATGTVQALTKSDRGKSKLMGLLLNKYIIPGDNQQTDHLTKMRMVDMYSQVYGVQPVLYDLTVTEKYLGPGTALLPIRSWFPQPGKLSIDDSDYNFVETWVSVSWLKSQKGRGTWIGSAIDEVIKRASEGGESKTDRPNKDKSVVEQKREIATPGGIGDAGQVRMITRYENGDAGRWITFFPHYDNLIGRDCANKDGHIPIVLKHHIPLIDSIYGLGAFERGKTLQYAMDSLNAMYLAGVQMSIFPPRIVQTEGVVIESLDYAPAATWEETTKDSIRNFEVSPKGMETFQSTYSWLTGALQSQNGVTDTTSTATGAADPTAGKTPAALQLQKQREGAADNWDRFMQERFLQTLYERLINLAPKTPKPFTLHIFDADIQQLKEAKMDDVMEVFESGKAAKVTAGAEAFGKDVEYKFIIDPKSTMATDDAAEHAALTEIIKNLAENPQLNYYMQQDGKRLNYGVLMERYVQTGGLTNGDEIVVDIEKPKAPPKQKPVLMSKDAKGQVVHPAHPSAVPGSIHMHTPQAPAQPAGAGQANNVAGQGGMNPMFYPTKKMYENINYDDLPLWAQVQMLPFAGIQIPPAVMAQAQQLGDNPPPLADPNAATAPDPTKNPDHELIIALIDKMDPASLRALLKSVNLPATGMLPTEAEMVKNLSEPSKTDERPIADDEADIRRDPNSPYGAAMDPHKHLANHDDPMVQNLYKHIMAAAKPGAPIEATPAVGPDGKPLAPAAPVATGVTQ